MAKRGRPAKTDQQKDLDGNPGKRPSTDASGGWPKGTPEPPPWVTGMAIDVWNHVVPKLTEAGILSPLDSLTLGSYCQSMARYIQAESTLTEIGTVLVIRNDKGEVKNQAPAPEFTLAIKYLEKANQIGERFGLSPVSRQTINAAKGEKSALRAFLEDAAA
jgi:P27 family predicted phage terminase small subunit